MTHDPRELRCPYPGLEAFTADNRHFFFGRTNDTQLLISNLYASALTVVYGASGVGKTSVILAGVVPEVEREGEALILVHRTWQDAARARALGEALAQKVGAAMGVTPPEAEGPLDVVAAQLAAVWRRPIFLVFDQFEEYFLYNEPSDDADSLDGELARLINRRDGHVNVMIVLREDSLAALDRFRHRIPTLLNNLFRLEHLTAAEARYAIEQPLAVLRERSRPDEALPVAIEPGLAAAVLDDLAALDRATPTSPASTREGARVELPFLQVVLERIWLMECRARSPVVRRATFDGAGGGGGIVRQRIQESLDTLDPAAQGIVASVLRHLVTPSGAKIALTMADLTGYAAVPVAEVDAVVQRLVAGDARILRRVTHPSGDPVLTKYEIYHDALGAPLLAWRLQMDRRRDEGVRRSKRRVRDAMLLLAGLVLVIAGVAAFLQRGKNRVEAREIASIATGQLEADNGRALLLAMTSIERSAGENAGEVALRRALFEPGERLRNTVSAEVERLTVSPDGQWIVGSSREEGALLWRASSLTRVPVPEGIDASVGASFDSASRRVLILDPRGPTVLTLDSVVRGSSIPRLPGTLREGHLLADGTRALMAYSGAGVVEWQQEGTSWREVARSPDRQPVPRELIVSPDERWVAWIAYDSLAIVDRRIVPWTVRKLRPLRGRIEDARFVSRNEVAVATGTDTVVVYSAESLGETERIALSCRVRRFEFASGEAAGHCGDTAVVLFNLPRQRSLFRRGEEPPLVSRTGAFSSVLLSPDGRFITFIPKDEQAPSVWSVLTRAQVTRLRGHSGGTPQLAFMPNARELVSVGRDSTIRTWEVVSASQRIGDGEFMAGRARVVLNEAATRAGMIGPYGAQMWDIERGRVVFEVPVNGALPVLALPLSGDRLATVAEDSLVQEFAPDDATGATRWVGPVFHPTQPSRMPPNEPFSDRTLLAYVANTRALVVTAMRWPPGGVPVDVAMLLDADGAGAVELARAEVLITALAIDSSGRRVAVAADDGVVQVRTLRGDSVEGGTWKHVGTATSVAFGGDLALASGGDAGDVRLARAARAPAGGFSPVVTLGKHDRAIAQLAFNRTASILASGDEGGTVRIWSVAAGRELCSLEGQHADYIRGLAFAPSGRTLASADEGGVAIWFVDEDTGRCRFGYRLVDLESPTEALRFAGDGSALVVVGQDGVIRRYQRALWAPRDSLLALARRRLRGRELSPAEIERYTRLR